MEIITVIPEMLSMPEIFVPIPVELQDVVSGRGDTIEISVLNAGDGTLNWTATTDASWITIISGSGAEDGKIEFTCKANSNSAERTGTIT